MSTRTKALLAIITAALLWSSAGVTAKLLFETSHPFVAASHRFLLASALLLPWFLREKKPKGFLRKLLPLGLLNAGNVLFYFSGLNLTTANAASILGTTAPLLTTVFAWFFIKERITLEKGVGIFFGLIGALFIVALPIFERNSTSSGSIAGNILLTGSLLCWTTYIVYARYILKEGLYSPVLSASINIFTVAVAATGAAVLTNHRIISLSFLSPQYMGILLYASIGITIITFLLFQWGVQHISASTASLKTYIQLISGVGLNAIFLNERLTGGYVIGSILVIIGIFLATGRQMTNRIRSYFANSS